MLPVKFAEDIMGEPDNQSESFDEDERSEEMIEHLRPEADYHESAEGNPFISLKTLISKLNDEDHSEDEGIQDYNIGGQTNSIFSYHPCHVGEVLVNRYVLMQKLGWGHFSTVWLAKDFKHSNYVAVKIMKSSPHYLQASYDEVFSRQNRQVQILQKVASNAYNPEWIKALHEYEPNKTLFDRDDTHVLNLLNSFLHKGPYGNHFCMVFEILGVNLLEVLKRYNENGLPLHLVKELARQVLMGLDFLNRICKVIHTDLKPENVLLCLTDREIKRVYGREQKKKLLLYEERLNFYRTNYKLGEPINLVEWAKLLKLQDKQWEEAASDGDKAQTENGMMLTNGGDLQVKKQQVLAKIAAGGLSKRQKKYYKDKQRKLSKQIIACSRQSIRSHYGESEEEDYHPMSQQELFSDFKKQLVLDQGVKLEPGFKVKIADLGNACWQHHHFATEIQTRQYRSPEVLIGCKYNVSADMWSAVCMIFEMLTGELLFNPRKDENNTFGKNDDHLAQIMELIGRFPKKFALSGTKARKYFSREGRLRRIPKFQNWGIKDVVIAKYRFQEKVAEEFENFMLPMLASLPNERVQAREMLKHPWLYTPCPENYFMNQDEHEKLRKERYDLNQPKEEATQYEAEVEDASSEDNHTLRHYGSQDEEYYGYQKVGNIHLVDRSFMDLGYIGYGDGIFLDELDAGPNWQFQSEK